MQHYYNIIGCIPRTVLSTSVTYLFYNWKFASLNPLDLFCLPPPPLWRELSISTLKNVSSPGRLCGSVGWKSNVHLQPRVTISRFTSSSRASRLLLSAWSPLQIFYPPPPLCVSKIKLKKNVSSPFTATVFAQTTISCPAE